MVGNDVVDLLDPESRAQSLHARFDARVFSADERRSIASSAVPATQRWRLWAAKEASYKVARKLAATIPFVPRRFEVSELVDGAQRARVVHGDQIFRVRLEESAKFVHAIAQPVEPAEGVLISGLERLDEAACRSRDGASPGRAARALACREVAALLGVAGEQLEVCSEDRIPRLYVAGRRAPADLSLSHHGAFVAFACMREASP